MGLTSDQSDLLLDRSGRIHVYSYIDCLQNGDLDMVQHNQRLDDSDRDQADRSSNEHKMGDSNDSRQARLPG